MTRRRKNISPMSKWPVGSNGNVIIFDRFFVSQHFVLLCVYDWEYLFVYVYFFVFHIIPIITLFRFNFFDKCECHCVFVIVFYFIYSFVWIWIDLAVLLYRHTHFEYLPKSGWSIVCIVGSKKIIEIMHQLKQHDRLKFWFGCFFVDFAVDWLHS